MYTYNSIHVYVYMNIHKHVYMYINDICMYTGLVRYYRLHHYVDRQDCDLVISVSLRTIITQIRNLCPSL